MVSYIQEYKNVYVYIFVYMLRRLYTGTNYFDSCIQPLYIYRSATCIQENCVWFLYTECLLNTGEILYTRIQKCIQNTILYI